MDAPLLRAGLATDFASGKSSAIEKGIRSILIHDFITVIVDEFHVTQGTNKNSYMAGVVPLTATSNTR